MRKPIVQMTQMAQNIEFFKWHGCYNDFICIHDHELKVSVSHPESSSLCRHLIQIAPQISSKGGSGLAADGILVLGKMVRQGSDLLLPLAIINRDGSVAQNCVNGLRVAAQQALLTQQTERPDGGCLKVKVITGQTYNCQIFKPDSAYHGHFGWQNKVRVTMDFSHTHPTDLPYDHRQIINYSRQFLESKGWHNSEDLLGCYYVGNHHLVWKPENISASRPKQLARLTELAQSLQKWLGADHLNVHMVLSQPPDITHPNKEEQVTNHSLLCWERGVGITTSCGSGAIASCLCLFERQRQEHKPPPERSLWHAFTFIDQTVKIQIQQRGLGYAAELHGPATFVYRGYYSYLPPPVEEINESKESFAARTKPLMQNKS